LVNNQFARESREELTLSRRSIRIYGRILNARSKLMLRHRWTQGAHTTIRVSR